MNTLVCSVCDHSNYQEMVRCTQCAWEFRSSRFHDSLSDLEQERYLGRRDLVRVRWKEFHQYDQTPEKRSLPAEGKIVQGAATTPRDLAIGGGLL